MPIAIGLILAVPSVLLARATTGLLMGEWAQPYVRGAIPAARRQAWAPVVPALFIKSRKREPWMARSRQDQTAG